MMNLNYKNINIFIIFMRYFNKKALLFCFQELEIVENIYENFIN